MIKPIPRLRQKQSPDYTEGLTKDLKGMKIGIPKESCVAGMRPEVETIMKEAIRQLEKLGAKVDWGVLCRKHRMPWPYITLLPRPKLQRTWRVMTVRNTVSLIEDRQHVGRDGKDQTIRLRTGSETPDYARHLCFIFRLLRCYYLKAQKVSR